MKPDEIKEILDSHALWLSGNGGQQADLSVADLSVADLSVADLSVADLSVADLSVADLSVAENIPPLSAAQTIIAPDGELSVWKKLLDGRVCNLLIPAAAQRSNATGRKCRASEAKVLAIFDEEGTPVKVGKSVHDPSFIYRVGETVKPDSFDPDRWNECGGGIHFFLTRIEAENYN